MLSQKLVKEILILNSETDSSLKKSESGRLETMLSLWKFNHFSLYHGSDSLGFPKVKNTALSGLFEKINPNFEIILGVATQFLDNNKDNKKLDENHKLPPTHSIKNHNFSKLKFDLLCGRRM